MRNPKLVQQVGLCRDDNGGTGSNPMIDRLESERDEALAFVERTVSEAQNANRDLTESERTTLSNYRARIAQLDEQLTPLREFAAMRAAHRQTNPGGGSPAGGGSHALGTQTEARGHEYRNAGEYMADAWKVKTKRDGWEDAERRLASVGRSVSNGRLETTDAATARSVDGQYLSTLSGEARASAPNVTTVEIPGVMPISIVGPIINDIDNARPFLNSIGVKDMSGIPGKSFTRPTVTEHVQMGTQSSEKTAVQAGQFKIDDVDFTKTTEGGYVDVSRQSIDWSSPAMWSALLQDFLDIYARHTENKAADAFVTAVLTGDAVDTETAGANATLPEYIAGLYAGAVQVYGDTQRMPNHVWMSLDVWAKFGVASDSVTVAGQGGSGIGSFDLGNFQQGGILTLPRTVVPSFAPGKVIIGVTNRVEAYEERLGFLSAVEPKLLGVELAYGGYFASGVLDVDAFAELTFTEGA